MNNSIKYRSVTYNGLAGEVMYGLGGTAGSMNSGSIAAAGFSYETGPISVGAVYFRSVNAADRRYANTRRYGNGCMVEFA